MLIKLSTPYVKGGNQTHSAHIVVSADIDVADAFKRSDAEIDVGDAFKRSGDDVDVADAFKRGEEYIDVADAF
ncbi:hypothetical protein F4803DRAFT_557107 [Xylaria telfairii]|nr:hypothetical protein F4803DRAFT_557107 [Xylaria telfairii]